MRVLMSPWGYRFDYVPPWHMAVSPVDGRPLDECFLVGHRFHVPLWKVHQRMKAKVYPYEVEVAAGSMVADTALSQVSKKHLSDSDVTGNDALNQMVQLFEGYVLADLKYPDQKVEGQRRWHRFVLAVNEQQVLLCEEWERSAPAVLRTGLRRRGRRFLAGV